MSFKSKTYRNRIVINFLMMALAATAFLYLLLFSRLDTVSRIVSLLALGCLATVSSIMFFTCRQAISFLRMILDKIDSLAGETGDRAPGSPEKILDKLDEIKNRWRAVQSEKQLLADTTRLIYSSSSLEELVDAVTTRLRGHFAADFGYFLLDDRQGCLKLKSTSGIKREDMKKTAWAYGEGLSGTAAANRKPLLCFDVEKDSDYTEAVPGTGSLLIVPLVTG